MRFGEHWEQQIQAVRIHIRLRTHSKMTRNKGFYVLILLQAKLYYQDNILQRCITQHKRKKRKYTIKLLMRRPECWQPHVLMSSHTVFCLNTENLTPIFMLNCKAL